MNFAMIGGKIWDFLKQVPIWVWIVIVAFITLKWIEADNFKKGQDAKAKEVELETERELGRIADARRHQSQENQDAAIRADEAVANLPRVTTTDGLRKHSKAVSDELLGPSPRSDG